MDQEELLKILENLVIGFGKLLGADTEIALHDLKKYELVYIMNGHVTGREVGYKMNRSVYYTILNQLDENGHSIAYGSHSANGKILRSSHFLVRDRHGESRALICVNQDTSKLREIKDIIEAMINCNSLEKERNSSDNDIETSGNYVQKMVQRIIIDDIEKMKPAALDSKSSKLEVIRQLEIKGIFSVKDAVPLVCKSLSISQATLYNYLREIHSENLF